LFIALLSLPLAGCGSLSTSGDFSPRLQQWLSKARYSSWETFRGPARRLPRKPDGLTIGSPHIFAGIGASPRDLSQIGPLYGDRKLVRALPSPLKFSIDREGDVFPLGILERQRLRRVAGTAIAVSESEGADFTVTTVDFSPLEIELNCLVRLVMVRNEGEGARFSLLFSGMMGELKRKDRYSLLGDRLGLVSDCPLEIGREGGSEVKIDLGKIGPRESLSAAIAFVPARESEAIQEGMERARRRVLADPVGALKSTEKDWKAWRKKVKAASGSPRLDDLMDSILCLMKSHVGFDALHTGSLRYPHTRAWTRDNYWVQRALLEAGLTEEARTNLEFFFSAWKKSGLSSYYEISTRRGAPYGNLRVELPHYLVLMVRDAEKRAGVDGTRYWPMVKDCLEKAGGGSSGLQPINGDETWLLAAGIDEVDYVLDNSWLLTASSEYGASLARRVGDTHSAERFSSLARKARQAVETYFFSPRLGRFAAARAGSEPKPRGLDEFPNPGVLARPVILGLYAGADPRVRNGLLQSWRDLSYSEGVRAYSRSGVVDGGTPGYFLYAASEARLPLSHTLAKRLEDFCSATGAVWELQSVTDPEWGLEKRRLWDSSVLLMGLLHYCKLRGSIPEDRSQPAAGPEVEAITIAESGPTIIEENSLAHARELATQLARHFGAPQRVEAWSGKLPDSGEVILVSPALPQALAVDRSRPGGDNYQICMSKGGVSPAEGRLLVWVKNRGDVFADLRGLEYDLFRRALPRREPAPFPDSDLEMAARIGERPSGRLLINVAADKPLAVSCAGRTVNSGTAAFSLELGKAVEQSAGVLRIRAAAGADRLVSLTVSARGGPTALARVEVIFPPGYWVVEARGLEGNWDRIEDPIDEVLRPDGGRAFVFQVHTGPGVEKSFTIRLSRPEMHLFSGEQGPPRR